MDYNGKNNTPTNKEIMKRKSKSKPRSPVGTQSIYQSGKVTTALNTGQESISTTTRTTTKGMKSPKQRKTIAT